MADIPMSITNNSSRGSASSDQDEIKFIVVGQKLSNNIPLQNALQYFNGEVVYSDTGFEHMTDVEDDTVFVLDNFDGSIFQRLHKVGCRIVAPPVIFWCAMYGKKLPYKPRPLFSMMMDKLILCFSGFKVKDNLSILADLVHRMGGSIRKEFTAKITHLVANSTNGEKYRAAVSLGTPIMFEEWVHRCWESRDEIAISAMDEHFMHYKLAPFSFAIISFYGFSKEETRHMEEVTVDNGGSCAEAGAPTCTHLVVDERTTRTIPFEVPSRIHLVKSEWLWASIQMDGCADEMMYSFEENEGTPGNPAGGKKTPKTLSGSKSHKRKRLRENLAVLASEGELEAPMCKRKSSEIGRRSLSSSFLDATADTSTPLSEIGIPENTICSPVTPITTQLKEQPAKLNARQQTVLELFQTEKNYVGILQTILKVFKEEIEKSDQPGGSILDAQDVKVIFGGIPPIYDIHVKIRDELSETVSRLCDDAPVGAIFMHHAVELAKTYPNFINYFEKTKEAISFCDRTKPRFHAFLRLCQSKPECGRQTLMELMIRPVQRLPSIMLLLKDILKRTDKAQPDFDQLNQAIAALEAVMTNINEDKRKAEGHQVMFEIVNDIENCPPNLLSAHRSLMRRIDAVEVSEELSGKGDPVTLFVFTDSLEICKRRTKLLNPKSPGSSLTLSSRAAHRSYKHLALIPFSCIKRVVDICETSECRNTFALITKRMGEKEKLYAFCIVDSCPDNTKEEFLTCVSKAICTNMCRTDYPLYAYVSLNTTQQANKRFMETLLAAVESHVLNLDTCDLGGNNTLSRAATRFGKRVSRAFSISKTPRSMKRAISSVTHIMSPMRRESSVFGLSTLAPSTPLGLSERPVSTTLSNFDESDTEMSMDGDCYSEVVDKMSIGTPAMQKRRETLAGVTYSDIQQEMKTPQRGVPDGKFATPLPVKPRPTPIGRETPSTSDSASRFGALRRDYASTQSLVFGRALKELDSPMTRSPSVTCANKLPQKT